MNNEITNGLVLLVFELISTSKLFFHFTTGALRSFRLTPSSLVGSRVIAELRSSSLRFPAVSRSIVELLVFDLLQLVSHSFFPRSVSSLP